MKRVAIIADSHFDESSRFEECIRLHRWIASDIAVRGVDLVLHSGDIFEGRSTPAERRAVAEWLKGVADIAPVIIVRGNHDACGDLLIDGMLDTAHPVIIEEAANVHVHAGIAVGALAWPQKAALLASLGRQASPEESSQLASEALRNVLRGLGQQMDAHDGPRIVLSHAMVRGSRASAERFLVGMDMEIGLEDLALARADLYALGHIHMHQAFEVAGAPAIYPGSPRHHDFGEREDKGYVFVEFDELDEPGPDGRRCGPARWEFVHTPATRLVFIDSEWRDGALSNIDSASVMNAEVRLRYRVPADQRDAARPVAETWSRKLLERGAATIKVEAEVVATTRARVPEVATAKTVQQKLDAYWRAMGMDVGGRREPLFAKLSQLESEES